MNDDGLGAFRGCLLGLLIEGAALTLVLLGWWIL